MSKYKNALFPIYQILHDETDDDRFLTQPQILSLLEARYQISLDRRTLYDQIGYLNFYGIEVETFQENRKGYRLLTRLFEKEEVAILIHLLQGATFIPEQLTKGLISKVLSTQSTMNQKDLQLHPLVYQAHKTSNKQMINVILLIIEAITHNHPIQLDYLRYNLRKKLEDRRIRPYVLHPYYIVNWNEKLYLICKHDIYKEIAFYRIDKMRNVKILHSRERYPLNKAIDPYSYVSRRPYMYQGEMVECTLRCQNQILDDVIDEFGQEIFIREDGFEHFILKLSITKTGLLYWVAQFHDRIEILEPKTLRQDYLNILEKTRALYQ